MGSGGTFVASRGYHGSRRHAVAAVPVSQQFGPRCKDGGRRGGPSGTHVGRGRVRVRAGCLEDERQLAQRGAARERCSSSPRTYSRRLVPPAAAAAVTPTAARSASVARRSSATPRTSRTHVGRLRR